MSGTHGDLYSEIGQLVLAAHTGQSLDITAKSVELAHRYWELGVPAETLAKVIARSLGAIGVSMALVSHDDRRHDGDDSGVRREARGGEGELIRVNPIGKGAAAAASKGAAPTTSPPRLASALFPSGVRLSLLS